MSTITTTQLAEALVDLNKRVTELEKENAELWKNNNRLVDWNEQLVKDVRALSERMDSGSGQSYTMCQSDLDKAIEAMGKDNPVESFMRRKS
ncbi:hypothetical protein [Methylobacterium iners]|uniref:Uncharacterized protein n=1 Tax=Methylobacterium iners TaxID=418707 RepID=A0ABQ4RXT5_9HYPH|nr:hypothetical protein [Methylobacterium iners]GJD94787.1 hypothetical protein OCOJLMKI_1991 [Methylobacterium iners]